jgi:hypothetical protein
MRYHLVVACLLSLGVLLVGCDKAAPPNAAQKSAEAETPERKLADLLKRAEQGDAEAQDQLGVMYDKGEGVPKDAAKAVEWYQKAAAQGNAWAQVHLGWAYESGGGVAKDDAKAVEWYHKAAVLGQTNAESALGWRYLNGKGVPKDTTKAFEYFQKASANVFSSDAQYNLGVMYSDGIGVPKDAAKAVQWFQKAAEMGHAEAQHNIGLMYMDGEEVPKDAAKAVEWYHKAAVQGHASAQNNLGVMYFNGQGAPLDKVLGYAWVNVAASRGNESENATKTRTAFESRMSAVEIAEAQRLSSSWKKGEVLVREGRSASTTPSATPGKLSKMGTGTLFLVNTTGQAITNHHVVAGCGELRIDGRDGLAKVVTDDAVNDLALVQIPGEAKASAAITSEPGKLRQGEDIVVFGFPLNAVLSSGGNLTPGVVSALTGLGNNTNQLQITAPIQPGSSGSPVLNKKGEVVGVVSMKLSDSKMAKATGQIGQNVNFAVNGQTLRTFLDTHKVDYRSGGGFFSRDKSTADLADEARKWTLVVECWR